MTLDVYAMYVNHSSLKKITLDVYAMYVNHSSQ